MKTNVTLTGILCLFLIPFGCEEKTKSAPEQAIKIEEYSASVANAFDQLAIQMKTEKVIFGNAEKNYHIGADVAKQLGSDNDSFKEAYTFGLDRYKVQIAARTSGEEIENLIVDLTAHDIATEAQEFMVKIAHDAYILPPEDIIAMIDNELNGANAQFYLGTNTVALKYILSIKELVNFFLNNPDLEMVFEDSEGRLRAYTCAYLIAQSTFFGAMLGGAAGFIIGTFVNPGAGSVMGGMSGWEGGALLGATLGGAAGGIYGYVDCNEENNNSHSTWFYDPNKGKINTSNINPKDLLVGGIRFSDYSGPIVKPIFGW
ncbi:MAG: hypothetical protein ABJF11_19625 [Reichenbachiella sp.]|uniref:hypothetical protein n=1 Tax=Reichenbachiella sp. TaxID=2184521 RepID=UPI00326683BB